MVLRFLFGLAGSLLSGSVVAVLFTVIVQHAFPDAAADRTRPLVKLAANDDERSPRISRQIEPATGPSHPDIQAAPDPVAHPDLSPSLQSDAQPAGQSSEVTVLTQEAAQNRDQLLAASGAAGLLAERPQAAEASEGTPAPPPSPDKLAGVAQPTTNLPTQERDPAAGPVTQRNAQDHKPTITASTVAADAHVQANPGGHATRGRVMTRTSHSHRRSANRSGDRHATRQQAQRQTQD
jgi:hypothetical protein